MCDRRPGRRSPLDSLLSPVGHRRSSAWSLFVCPTSLAIRPHRRQTRLAIASRGRPPTQPPLPNLHTYRPSRHSDRENGRRSHSIPIAATRLPQTRAASFKWFSRKRPGPNRHPLSGTILLCRFRYSSNTSHPLRETTNRRAGPARLKRQGEKDGVCCHIGGNVVAK
jgi:hypothetical protein